MKNVLLIGATGFVGSALLNELLSRGHKVTAIVRDAKKMDNQNDNLIVVEGDATDIGTVKKLAAGKDAVVSAYNAGWGNPRQYEENKANNPKILEGAKLAGVERLLLVGGAGILYVAPGVRLAETDALPEAWIPGVKSMYEFYLETVSKEQDIDWVYLAPAGNLGNMTTGERTGKYRMGTDTMLTDAEGNSFISVEDYAVAMVDELEQPKHHKELFTVAY